MKKLMFALLVAVCSSLMAEVLVYDYTASFKRIDVKDHVKVKYNGTSYKLDTAKVVSDKFVGYVVIGACEECTKGVYTATPVSSMIHSAQNGMTTPGNFAVVYIRRTGAAKEDRFQVWRSIGRFYAAKFSQKAGKGKVDAASSYVPVNPDKFTDAAGLLSFWIGGYTGFMGTGHNGYPLNKVKGVVSGGTEVTYYERLFGDWWDTVTRTGTTETYVHPTREDVTAFGWLGNDGLRWGFDTIDNAGFGKVVSLKQIIEQSCFEDKKSTCWAVKDLSGSIEGAFMYTGPCNDPLYDLCYVDVNKAPESAYLAPIAGTFTMKLNNSLSFKGKAFQLKTFTAAENAIIEIFEKQAGKNIPFELHEHDPEIERFNKFMGENLYLD